MHTPKMVEKSKISRISKDHKDFGHCKSFFTTWSLKEDRGGFCSQLRSSDFSEFRQITGVRHSSSLAKHFTLHLEAFSAFLLLNFATEIFNVS